MPKRKVPKACDVSRFRVAHMPGVVKRLYMRILRLAVLLRSHVRTTQLTLCINDAVAQYVTLLLLLLVQTKTLPRMYLIFLQHCVDSDSTKLHCNTITQHLWACFPSPFPLTGSSCFPPPYWHPEPYPQLPPSSRSPSPSKN
jgi:hypothetical protein